MIFFWLPQVGTPEWSTGLNIAEDNGIKRGTPEWSTGLNIAEDNGIKRGNGSQEQVQSWIPQKELHKHAKV